MSNKDDVKIFLTPGQVADLFMVSAAAVRLWAEKGELKALTTPGGHRRYLRCDMEEFAKLKNLTLNEVKETKLRVLIVDDDQQFSGYLEKLLGKYHDLLIIETASDGFDAGIKVRDFQPEVVLLDLMMPGLDGYQVCERLMSSPNGESIRVIAMTGYPTTENIRHILAAGAEVCLPKPIDRDRLFEFIGIPQRVNN